MEGIKVNISTYTKRDTYKTSNTHSLAHAKQTKQALGGVKDRALGDLVKER